MNASSSNPTYSKTQQDNSPQPLWHVCGCINLQKERKVGCLFICHVLGFAKVGCLLSKAGQPLAGLADQQVGSFPTHPTASKAGEPVCGLADRLPCPCLSQCWPGSLFKPPPHPRGYVEEGFYRQGVKTTTSNNKPYNIVRQGHSASRETVHYCYVSTVQWIQLWP